MSDDLKTVDELDPTDAPKAYGNRPDVIEALKKVTGATAVKTFVKTIGNDENSHDVYVPGYRTLTSPHFDGKVVVSNETYVFVSESNHTHHVPGTRVREFLPAKQATK